MNIFQKLFTKAAPQPIVTNQQMVMHVMPRRESPTRDFDGFAKDGYQKNVIAARCVNLISDAIGGLPFVLFQVKNGKKVKIESHKLLDLIKKPNKFQGQQEYFKEASANLMLGGNSFMSAVKPFETKPPMELYNLGPGKIKVISGNDVWPIAYEYKLVSGTIVKYPINPVTGESLVLHTKLYNPLNQWYGQSPLEAAASEVDQFNEMNIWNYSLLSNGARPSFVVTVKNDGGKNIQLSDQQRKQLREDIDTIYAGAKNTGRPMLLENGMEAKELQLSPKEMDYLKNKEVTKTDIGNAYGVPGQMLGVQGSQTFANYAQARESFYIESVLPIAKLFLTDINGWLVPMFGDNLELAVDESKVEALEVRRQRQWDKVEKAGWLSINEKREATGMGRYEPTGDPADTIFVSGNMFPLDFATEVTSSDNKEPLKKPKKSSDYTVIEGKQFNLSTAKQKRRAWFEFNKKQQRFERRFSAHMSAIFSKQGNDVVDAIGDASPDLISFIIDSAIGDSTESMNEMFRKNNGATFDSFGQDVLDIPKFTDIESESKQTVEDEWLEEVLKYARRDGAKNVNGIQSTTRKKVAEAVAEGIEEGESTNEIKKRVEKTFSGFSPTRSRTIARTEVHSASNTGSREAARKLSIPNMEKEWLSAQDERTRGNKPTDTSNHIVMNGSKVMIEDKFEVPSKDGIDLMDGPGDITAPVDQIANCRCTQIYVSKGKR